MDRATGAARSGRNQGFTIIEVIFFLAISGALIAVLLSTVGFTISRQRFTDSVVTTQAYMQSQYSGALNVQNDRDGGSCSAGSGDTTVLGSGTTPRGAASSPTCVILGRAVDFTPGTSRAVSYAVVGREPTETGGAAGKDLLKLYAPSVDTGSAQNYDVPWDAKVSGVRRSGGDPVTRLLLLRSPDSGLILTFGGGTDLTDALNRGTATFDVCLTSADITNSVSLVSLSPVSGSEGVTTRTDLTGTEQGSLC